MAAAIHEPVIRNVFVCGPFMNNEMLHAIDFKCIPQSSRATLAHHRVTTVPGKGGRPDSAIVPSQDESVTGRVLLGLNDSQLRHLHAQFGKRYEKIRVEVTREDGAIITADTHIWRNEQNVAGANGWNNEAFRSEHMATSAEEK